MKTLAFFLGIISVTVSAQNSFRIFDPQMVDVTNGMMIISDTNATMMQLDVTVENVDTVAYNVIAGRLVIIQPATASNAFTWGLINYPPSADSSAIAVNMPVGNVQPFEGYYFPNGNNSTATINYCFWETTDQNNNSCVTVTYNNFLSVGISPETKAPVSIGPNPAGYTIGFGWSNITVSVINIYSSQGVLVHVIHPEMEAAEVDLTNWPEGLFFYQMVEDSGATSNGSFLHLQPK